MILPKEKIIEEYQAGISTNRLGEKYNCNPGSIYYILKENNIPVKKKQQFKGSIEDYANQILLAYDNGDSIRKIARDLSISTPVISDFLSKNGKNISRYNDVDPNNLVEDKADKIIELHENGVSTCKIAKIVGNSQAQIWKFLRKHGFDTKKKVYDIDINFFKKIDSEAKAWVLGWLYSDGNVTNRCWRIEIQDSDRDVLEKIKELIKYSGPIGNYINKHKTLMAKLYISRVSMVKDLIKLGCIPKKSLIINFPTQDIVPKQYLSAFVRGVYGGDGSHSKEHTYVSLTGSYNFMHELIHNIPCEYTSLYQSYSCKKKQKAEKDSSWELRISKQKEMLKFLNWIYHDANFYLERKYQRYQEFLQKYESGVK